MINFTIQEEISIKVHKLIKEEIELNFGNLSYRERVKETCFAYRNLFSEFIFSLADIRNESPMKIFEHIKFLDHLEYISQEFNKKKENKKMSNEIRGNS